MVDDLIDFSKVLVEFNRIQRDLYLNYLSRNENDAEHSFQLAMTVWFLYQKHNLNLNFEKVIMYSLIHDLVEVYAGDTPLYSNNKRLVKTKSLREKKALHKLMKEFGQNSSLSISLKNYFHQIDYESKFVKSVDKLLPVLNIYIDGGHAWDTHNVDTQDLYNTIFPKIREIPITREYFEALIQIIKKDNLCDPKVL